MAMHLTPDPGDPGEPRVKVGRTGGSELGEERRLVRDGAQMLAHGALVCPACELPIVPVRRLPAFGPLRCAFCNHTAPAHEFVREDVYDTVANEVYVVARVT